MTHRVGRKSRALTYPDRPMTMKDLPATLRRFTLQSRACSARFVSKVTRIPYPRVIMLRHQGSATDDEIKELASLFGVTEQFMKDTMPLLKKWSECRSSGAFPPA